MQFPCSDALSYSHLAEGKLDIVIQCGNKIWDIHPLIQSLGQQVVLLRIGKMKILRMLEI